MKSATLLASLLVLSISPAAAALSEGAPRPIVVAGCPSGIASFFLAANGGGPAGFCSYYMDWQSPFLAAGSVPCYVQEQKSLGQTSCLLGRLFDAPSVITSAPSCQGFDNFGIPGNVNLVLGEGAGGGLSGVAVFASSPFLPRPILIG
jgi:hypothetical protein